MVEGGVVKAGKEVEWKEQIIVPPLPQSSLAGCELIKIEYFVKVGSYFFSDTYLVLLCFLSEKLLVCAIL